MKRTIIESTLVGHSGPYADGFHRIARVLLDCGHHQDEAYHRVGDPQYSAHRAALVDTTPLEGGEILCKACAARQQEELDTRRCLGVTALVAELNGHRPEQDTWWILSRVRAAFNIDYRDLYQVADERGWLK